MKYPMLSGFTIEQLEEELQRRKDVKDSIPTELFAHNWTSLIKHVRDGINEAMKNGRWPKDFEHYTYEAVMEAMYGKEFWAWYNCQDFSER